MSLVPYSGSREGSSILSRLDRGRSRSLSRSYKDNLSRNFKQDSSLFKDIKNRQSLATRSIIDDGDNYGSRIDAILERSFGNMSRMMNTMMRDPFESDPFFDGGANANAHQAALMPSTGLLDSRLAALRGRANPFQMINPMALMQQNMENMTQGANCHSFSSSSVMTMTRGPDGNPQVYQASSSTRQAPGGVKEVRQTMADSLTGTRKMAIGHHIDDRAHVVEKEVKNGELEERQELINLDEDDVRHFDSEFRRRSQPQGYPGANSIDYRPRHRASPSSPLRQQRSTYLPALPASSSSYRRRTRPQLDVSGDSSRY